MPRRTPHQDESGRATHTPTIRDDSLAGTNAKKTSNLLPGLRVYTNVGVRDAGKRSAVPPLRYGGSLTTRRAFASKPETPTPSARMGRCEV
jgi:hypothetical protein